MDKDEDTYTPSIAVTTEGTIGVKFIEPRKPIPARLNGWAEAYEPPPCPTGARGLDE